MPNFIRRALRTKNSDISLSSIGNKLRISSNNAPSPLPSNPISSGNSSENSPHLSQAGSLSNSGQQRKKGKKSAAISGQAIREILPKDWIGRDPLEEFQLLELLGEGSFGIVHRALHVPTKLVIAIKIVPISEDSGEIVKKEIEILSMCDCPYIASYFGSFLNTRSEIPELWILTDYCETGSLKDLLPKIQSLSEKFIAFIARSILHGLE
eukprot:TRINITY_DN3207_c0_g2_i1.p3 TRINITY_DN3207_c0_g2~~TRINITY_DN3207_c0_g2_i1.p3  ORF type:complete len:229 (+),score=80.55 TRINITY_DN3207_c0_g2_i1:60-689(+)